MKLEIELSLDQPMNSKNKMKKWLEQFESDMAAASFAEAGELDTAREMMKEDRRILLAVTNEKRDANAFRYALSMCKRIGAALEIMFPMKSGRETLESFISELKDEGIEHTLVEAKECIKEEILNYTNKKRNILFVVVESSDALDIHCQEIRKEITASWSRLKCPLVVVSDLASA